MLAMPASPGVPRRLFTVFADTTDGSHSDIYMHCDTLDDAMSQLRQLIETELGDPGGTVFDRYGVYVRDRGKSH